MTVALDELDHRLTALEQEMAALQRRLDLAQYGKTPAERGCRSLRAADISQPSISATWCRALEEMGIRGHPIGAERVQELIARERNDTNGDEFSRGIINMREE